MTSIGQLAGQDIINREAKFTVERAACLCYFKQSF